MNYAGSLCVSLKYFEWLLNGVSCLLTSQIAFIPHYKSVHTLEIVLKNLHSQTLMRRFN